MRSPGVALQYESFKKLRKQMEVNAEWTVCWKFRWAETQHYEEEV